MEEDYDDNEEDIEDVSSHPHTHDHVHDHRVRTQRETVIHSPHTSSLIIS
jgi:hypothetical protein